MSANCFSFFVLQIRYWGFTPIPRWGTSVPRTLGYTPKWKFMASPLNLTRVQQRSVVDWSLADPGQEFAALTARWWARGSVAAGSSGRAPGRAVRVRGEASPEAERLCALSFITTWGIGQFVLKSSDVWRAMAPAAPLGSAIRTGRRKH